MKRYLINCYKKTRMVNWQILILTLSITACQPNVQKLESNESIVESDAIAENFLIPPNSTRPGVYWYFMDGNQNRDEMTADLEAMARAGIGKVVFLEVNIGVPRGPVNFMSEEWQDNFVHAVKTTKRLGIELILGTGPGWAGSGGPWVKPEDSMQHLVAGVTEISGPKSFKSKIAVPKPPKPNYFAGMSEQWIKVREDWYEDVSVLAFPTPSDDVVIDQLDLKTLKETQPYSIWKHIPRYVRSDATYKELKEESVINQDMIIDLSNLMSADGTLEWEVPEGNWTIMRFVSRTTGQTTRPAPTPGHGFETDKFNPESYEKHWNNFQQKLLDRIGPRELSSSWTRIHLDSWEMSSQNWSKSFQEEFINRRGYDPKPFYPAFAEVAYERGWTGVTEMEKLCPAFSTFLVDELDRGHDSGLFAVKWLFERFPWGSENKAKDLGALIAQFLKEKYTKSVVDLMEAALLLGKGEDLKKSIESHLGSQISKAEITWGGYTPAANFKLELHDGRQVFCKGLHSGQTTVGKKAFEWEFKFFSQLKWLERFAPKFLGHVASEGWEVKLFEFIADRNDVPPWTHRDISQLLDRLHLLHSMDILEGNEVVRHISENGFSKNLYFGKDTWSLLKTDEDIGELSQLFEDPKSVGDWGKTYLSQMLEIESGFAQLDLAESFIHVDLRSDNILFSKNSGQKSFLNGVKVIWNKNLIRIIP